MEILNRIILIFVFFFVFFSVDSKGQKSVVKYNIKLTESLDSKITDKTTVSADLMKGANDFIDKIEFTLKIDDTIASFKQDDFITRDNEYSYARIASKIANDYEYFYNLKNNQVICKKEFAGDIFIVTQKTKNKWQIKNDTKTILGFTCRKATQSLTKLDETTVVEVWFAPEINIPVGPVGFNSLPGLILELKHRNTIYKANKIVLDEFTNNGKIEIPRKGISISEEDFDSFLKEKINLFTKRKI